MKLYPVRRDPGLAVRNVEEAHPGDGRPALEVGEAARGGLTAGRESAVGAPPCSGQPARSRRWGWVTSYQASARSESSRLCERQVTRSATALPWRPRVLAVR